MSPVGRRAPPDPRDGLPARTAMVAAAWAVYALLFLLLAPRMGPSAASLATLPAILGGLLLGGWGGLAMGVVSLLVNEALLVTTGRAFDLTPADAYYASLSAIIGGGVGWVQTTRLRMHEAARLATLSNERSQLVTRATKDMVWDWDLRSDIVWRNEPFEEFLGPVAKPVRDTSAWRDRIHPDDAERIVASVRAALASPDVSEWSGEYRLRAQDGSWRVASDRGYITRDASGRATRMLGSIQDVTAQRAAERALAESEQAFRTLFQNVPVGLYRTTPDGRILLANPALLRLLGHDSMAELHARDLNEGIEADHSRESFKTAIEANGAVRDLVSTWTTLDGRTLHVREDATLVRDADGKPLYYEGSVEDLTPKVRLEAEARERQAALERSERLSALGTLVAGVAHEVNNPLAYIRGNVELVQMGLDDLQAMDVPPAARAIAGESRAQLDVALRGIEQLATIANSLKIVARRSSGKKKRESLDSLIESVILVAEARMPPDATVRAELAATRPIDVVSEQVTQVLLNLLINSADAVRDRRAGEIVVRTYERPHETIIEVADNGVGIPPEQRTRIFLPFHTTKPDGTGLGLSVSHGIVESHGGRMSFESAVGKGTTFRVALPRVDDPHMISRAT